MSYARQTSPNRRSRDYGASSADPDARYVSRTVDRVIPISSHTFLNPPRESSRRHSLVDRTRRPIVHEVDRVSSPPRTREYHVVALTPEKKTHKKVYSIGEDGAQLVEHRKHRSRDTYDKKYPAARKSIEDEDAYSYTDAAGMFRDTQPSWRERPRETSLDRVREEPRAQRRDGPPPSQRGWDKIQDIGRTRSVRDGPRERRASVDRRAESDYDDDYRRSPRRSSLGRRDRSVSRRGFGIRLDSPDRKERRYSPEGSPRRPSPGYGYAKSQRERPEVKHERKDYRDEPKGRDDRKDHRDEVKVAAAGLGAAAGLYAMGRDRGNSVDRRHHEDDRAREDDRYRDDDRYDRHRRDDRRHEDRVSEDRRHEDRHSDGHSRAERPYPDDRGLGFAFEEPRSKRASPPAEEPAPLAIMPAPAIDPDEEYRRRIAQAQRDLGYTPAPRDEADRERRRREREARHHSDAVAGADSPRSSADGARPELRRKASIIDEPLPAGTQAQIIDNSQSDKRETRVRIVDPPTEEEEKKPKSILKAPTKVFPEYTDTVREGVAPLKDATKKGIPPGARWTKIDRRLVNPEALEQAKERYEERQDCVIVLRVLTKESIQRLADKTKELRDKRFETERRSREQHDDYSDDGLEDWERGEKKPMRMLEAAPAESREHRERDGSYASSRDRD